MGLIRETLAHSLIEAIYVRMILLCIGIVHVFLFCVRFSYKLILNVS